MDWDVYWFMLPVGIAFVVTAGRQAGLVELLAQSPGQGAAAPS